MKFWIWYVKSLGHDTQTIVASSLRQVVGDLYDYADINNDHAFIKDFQSIERGEEVLVLPPDGEED